MTAPDFVRPAGGGCRATVAALESFNRQVAHDLRTPVGNIAQLAELASAALARGDLGFLDRALPAIHAQAASAVELVAALMALAHSAEEPLPVGPVALDTVVRSVLDNLPRDAAPSSCRIVVGALPEVCAHAGLLRQVYANLLGNALKFTRARAQPWILVGGREQAGEHVLYVRDNGVGFDQGDAGRLFAPFQRLHGGAYPGHGLGLSIARRIVERHGGRIWCRSRPDRGTTMYFSLPRHAPAAAGAGH
ncbi:hypothetical protein HLB44_21805 [Aquincola sp. S2]|uniref:histidine kinase n=1 Tax=Pseudaquabacterium terrae TaxID=2732868 RepID=A0ABX2EM21_9BURK|nr:ATP-binding protein [Aquabacterium terrae]NRF69643.1 hypothetical protein [Aquabacterium terrae]